MKRWNLVLLYLGIFLTIYGQKNISQDSISFIHAAWVHDTLSNGVFHAHCHFDSNQIFNSNQNIHILRVAKSNSNVQWKIGTAGNELLKTSTIAQKEEALAAVNGSFFNMKKGGSVNFIRINGIMTDTSANDKGPGIYGQNQSGAFAYDDKNFVILKRDIPGQGKWEENIPFPNVMECGPILLVDTQKQPLLDSPFNNNRHPRTCVCVTENETLLITADGRNALAQGLSLHELTDVLIWLGCKNGLNLDGGGSTTFYLRDKGVVNMPCDNKLWDHEGERPVSNALMLVLCPDK
jgi:exopolysaccharide biosynthesis protein